MEITIDSSGVFTYFFFLLALGAIIAVIYYIIKRKIRLDDIKINPLAPIFGLLFIIGLWLADLTTLNMGTHGLYNMVGLNPVDSSRVPALFIWCIGLIAMFSINYFFTKMSERKENKKEYYLNKMLVYTQLVGMIAFVISALAMGVFGYDSTFLGFYTLNLYHSTLPMIIFTLFMLVVNTK